MKKLLSLLALLSAVSIVSDVSAQKVGKKVIEPKRRPKSLTCKRLRKNCNRDRKREKPKGMGRYEPKSCSKYIKHCSKS